jgi:3-phenylpropionate/cinnamic acid dioxygenase small subunit
MGQAHGQIGGEAGVTTGSADVDAVRDVVQRTAVLLDDEKFVDWVSLFAADGTYEISAYSTEIRRWMTWQLSDRPALEKMLGEVHEHVRDPARRRHVVGYPLINIEGDIAAATASFSLFRTTPEGQSSLYMVGVYEDRLVMQSGVWRYRSHKVVVDTRMLDMFTHIPV